MKFFTYLFMFVSAFYIAFACDQGCTATSTSIQVKLEAVVSSCNELQNWQKSGSKELQVTVDAVIQALADVETEIDLFAGTLTETEFQLILQTLVNVQVALHACFDILIDLDINILGLIDININLDIVGNLVVDLWIKIDAVLTGLVGICSSSSQPKIQPICNKIKNDVQKCCGTYNQQCS